MSPSSRLLKSMTEAAAATWMVFQPSARRHRGFLLYLVMTGGIALHPFAALAEWDFELGIENRYFPQEAAYGEPDNALSVSGRVKYGHEWNDGADLLDVEAFYRWSETDDERTHGDIQDLAWIHVGDQWEFRGGIRTVFWGVTEFQHLVDIINQADTVERNDGEARLGQPMLNLSLVRDWGILDLYALVGFRERTFPGMDGRPRAPLRVDGDAATYESGAEEKHIDFAARWSGSFDSWEVALSYFGGTSRDPEFNLRLPGWVLEPYYPQIEQVGLEAQFTHEMWLWKLEALTRSGMEDGRYAASVFGFEYTFEGVFDSVADLGLIAEYNWDERGDAATSYLNHDIALGTRLAFNDEFSTDLIAGLIYDHDTHERVLTLEAHRRLGDAFMLNVEMLFFSSRTPPEPVTWYVEDVYRIYVLAPNSHDDYLQVELVYYF